MNSLRGPSDAELPHIAAIQVMFESGFTDLSTAVEVAVHMIGTTPLHNYFAILGGDVGRQLRGITWHAIHDRLNPAFKDWLQSGDPSIEAGINRLTECANEFGLKTDDL
jgi:hypothetical protein